MSASAPKNPLDEFDPNAAKPKHPFATYCPTRYNGGSFKLHSQRAYALSALSYQDYGVLYEYENGLWVERARFNSRQFRPTTCDGCGRDTMEFQTRRNFRLNTTETLYDRSKINVIGQFFERDARGKLVDPLKVLSLCPDCQRGMGY